MSPKVALGAAPFAAAAAVEPTLWYPLGYTVEAGSLCAGLIACLLVRIWVGARTTSHRWTIDIPVSALTLLFTAMAIVSLRPNLIAAGVIGTGLGAVGAGIISKAQAWANKWLGDQAPGPVDPSL